MVEILAQLNILYDEDKCGSFDQLYTQPIDGRFYFEFVQRDGYRGLGATNAWLRASAQQIDAISTEYVVAPVTSDQR